MEIKKEYNSEFYARMKQSERSNTTSAQEIVPYILSLNPKATSVVDFGCGVGAWLKAFYENGIADLTGVDGEWLDRKQFFLGG